MSMPIVHRDATVEEIRTALREAPLGPVRGMLTDATIYRTCRDCGYRFRRRTFDPVVTVLHFLVQAIQREESFAATWQELWTPLAADFPELASTKPARSSLTHARSRLPAPVMQALAGKVCGQTPREACESWRGFRLVALDGTTTSMPREDELFDHFGAHRARTTTVRYPLARFVSLLAVGSSAILDYRFGPFTVSEVTMGTELLSDLGGDDLLLADRGFSGSPTFARLLAGSVDFLMRKHPRLNPAKAQVVKRLGRDDFIIEMPMNRPAQKLDLTLPRSVRVRLFKAMWISPAGERLTDWFVTSLTDAKRFRKRTLATLYHERWQIETSYEEFKQIFHSDVLRSKTVDNVEKEFAAHVLAYQLVRRLITAAAKKHHKKPTQISFLDAARWVVTFSHRMAASPAWALPIQYQRLLDSIAASEIDVRPGRIEPRALTREWKHYPHLRMSRTAWREQQLGRAS